MTNALLKLTIINNNRSDMITAIIYKNTQKVTHTHTVSVQLASLTRVIDTQGITKAGILQNECLFCVQVQPTIPKH